MKSHRSLLFTIGLLSSLSLHQTGVAEEAKKAPLTLLDPDKAGPDFLIQGDYIGENISAQVIAEGGGNFRIIGWKGGFGGSSAQPENKSEVRAKTSDGKVILTGDGWNGVIENGELSATNAEGNSFVLRKSTRRSRTLLMTPPKDAIILFDGKSADQWESGVMDDRKLLAGGTKTKKTFRNFHLHLEFRTPFMPESRGQARGNSGVYLQNRYECQVLDSYGLEGAINEAGAIYKIAKPLVNMCLPPLSWQTYDIDFEAAQFDDAGNKRKNAVITLRFNDVLVQDHVEVPEPTPGAGLKETPEPGPILLQNHGNPVYFRNIWLVEKP